MKSLDHLLARRLLLGRCDCVFEVEEDEIRVAFGRSLYETSVAARNRELRPVDTHGPLFDLRKTHRVSLRFCPLKIEGTFLANCVSVYIMMAIT